MFDEQEIKRAGFEEVLRQMPAAVVIAEAPSGKITFVNREAQQWTEQVLGQRVPSELEQYRDLQIGSNFKMLHPDGRPYEIEEWPLIRSVRSGEEVRGEEIIHLLGDGTQLWARYDSSPIYDDEGRIVASVLVAYDITEQKRTEERLAYYARLLENAEDAIIAVDDRFVVTTWSKGAERLYGWTADEVLDGDVGRAIRLDMSDAERTDMRRQTAEDGLSRRDVVAFRKDGTPVEVEFINVAVRGEQGELTGFLGIHRDITERKRAEEALRESNRRTENVLESTTDAFFALDRQWRFIYINERGLRQLQGNGEELTREEVLGKNAWELYPELVGSVFYQKYHEAMREQKAVEFEAYSEPSEQWYEVHAYPSEEGLALYRRDISDRKHAERELRESKRRNEEILESVTDGFYAMDRDWRFTYLNARAVRFASQLAGKLAGEEFTHEGLLGRTLWETLPATVGTKIEEEYRRAVREQQTTIFEYPYPGGSQVFEVHAYPSEQGLSVYFQDITERKRAEGQLAYYAGLRENMHDAFIATDERLLVKAWNKGAEKMYGWTASEALGQYVREVVSLEMSDEQLAEVLQEIAETGRLHVEQVQRHKDGTPFHVDSLTIAMRNERGEATGYLAINRDITERKRAEKEIVTRHHQQATVVDLGRRAAVETNLQSFMDEAVALTARTLEVEYCKIAELLPSGEELLMRAGVGWREGLVGRATEGTRLDSQTGYTLLSEVPVVVEDLRTETRFRPSCLLREHGVVSGMTVVISGRDKPFGVLGAHTKSHRSFTEDDVNFLQAAANVLATAVERTEVEEKLNEVREAERSRIAQDLHDEALQDLTYALMEAHRLQSSSKDPEPANRLERLVAALDRMGPRLRGAIYDLSLEGEQDRPFSELLQSLVELQRTMAPESNISLETHDRVLEEPLGQRGKEVLRIVGEALTNARRHSGAHNIRVSVSTIEDKKLLAEVSDDGRGFDVAEELSASSSTGGMGIRGMRERARALGGDLKIESEPAKGTKVSFELSLEKEREEPEGEEEERIRILLVEDHATVRDALASALEGEAGFEVMGQAESLAQARRILAQEPVDVAVVDLGLPDGYGGDLIKELRETNPQAQALVLSASIDRAQLARAVEHGAAGILNKTVHLDEVVEAVRGLRSGQTLMPLEEVVELLRFAGSQREEEYEARKAIEKLTPREIEVLQALAEGLDSQEIAERLKISIRTERNHMASILAKLEVHSQLQALVFAVRHGVAEIP